MNHIKIIVPFHNVEKWILYNIRSVKLQEHKDYECILVSDGTTDSTISIIEKEIDGDDRFKLVFNPQRTGALGSTYYGIEQAEPSEEDIIVILDGDDWFFNKDSLRKLNNAYIENSCWMTYGSYVEYPSGDRGKFSRQIPTHIIENSSYRRSPWMTSHLRTFKYKLWRRIKKEDLQNQEGKFYPMCGDFPVVLPMLEMSGKRSHYVDDVLLVYNRSNPANEDKINHQLQLSIEAEVRSKPKYDLLEEE
tara:strand:+ start:74 stop:817 length:744 start_codon:yes stop_codon:yes gene_type:complete